MESSFQDFACCPERRDKHLPQHLNSAGRTFVCPGSGGPGRQTRATPPPGREWPPDPEQRRPTPARDPTRPDLTRPDSVLPGGNNITGLARARRWTSVTAKQVYRASKTRQMMFKTLRAHVLCKPRPSRMNSSMNDLKCCIGHLDT